MSDMTDHLFILAGMHYYVAGRYAIFAGLNPTAANLLHHAIEMTLKGVLAKKGMDLKALKGLGHDLPSIWRDSGDATRALWLGEIDELMDKVFTVGSIGHGAYASSLIIPGAKE